MDFWKKKGYYYPADVKHTTLFRSGRSLPMRKTAAILIFVSLFTLCASVAAFAADDVIGVVEFQRCVASHPKFQQVQNQMKAADQKKKSEAEAAFNKAASDQKKYEAIQQKQMELAKEQRGLMAPLLKDVDLAIRKVVQAKKITVVMEKDATFAGGIDITSDVISALK